MRKKPSDEMNIEPLVSVITIFLNEEKFIQDAIQSVFAQTYENWELLLVDDGTTDDSSEIALLYAKRYPEKIHYFKHAGHQNRGMAASRNLGISKAKGEYIAFLDADDVFLPHKLEQQVAILNSQPAAAMIYGRSQIWYSWTGDPKDIHRDHVFDLGVKPNTLVLPPELLILLLQNRVQTPTTCNAMMRRQVFEEIGGFEEAFGGMYEDITFFAKVCLKAPVFVADECWARYRQHPDSCSSVIEKRGDGYSARLPLLNWIEKYVSSQNDSATEVWDALQKALRPYHHPIRHRLSRQRDQLLNRLKELSKQAFRSMLPAPVRTWLRARLHQGLDE